MKKILALILALLMLFTMAACVSEPDDSESNDTPDTSDSTDTTEPVPVEPAPQTIRIGTYNIANGGTVDHNFDVLAEEIIDLDLDIVGLQEVDKFTTRSKFTDGAAGMAKSTGLKYYQFVKAINLTGSYRQYGRDGEYGIAIISRYPIITSEFWELESDVHEQRMLLHVVVDVDGTLIDIYNTHLSWEEDIVRAYQFDDIDKQVKNKPYAIVTGDFNIDAYTNITDRMTDINMVANEENPIARIDNILYQEGYKLLDCGVVETKKSDHDLVWAEFEILPLPETEE